MISQALHSRRSAFTLIELIVVVVLLGVLAGLVAPRLLTTERRRAEATVTDLTSMLSVVARRDALGNSRMALEYDAERGTVKLDTLRVEGERFGTRQTAWRPDPLTPRVELEGIEITETRVDGYSTGEKWWRIEFAPGVPRPLIELVVQYTGPRPK
ncbi:MAG: prepilin-type N-terminal cleavage/methylation domain-containing protein, partial [Planctomycetota bacterium]